MNTAAIVIPIYKAKLNNLEEISLKRCFDILGKHPIYIVKPNHLNLYQFDLKNAKIISFNDEYFSSVEGYNKLMLSAIFYEAFLNFNYILIYQLDALVFCDELLEWCNKGYDYIGAPWLMCGDYPDLVKKLKNNLLAYLHTKYNKKIKNSDLPSDRQFENKVGNGGFSLRNPHKFHKLCQSERTLIDVYLNKNFHRFNEDIFWGVEINRKQHRLKIPNYKKAVFFSIENSCEFGFELTKGKLPFGCHAWDKHLEFWRPLFADLNIII